MMLIVIAVGYSVIAVANSMAMAAHGRRRDFGVMKSAGGTVRQLLFTSAGETALVIVIGAALGVLVTLPRWPAWRPVSPRPPPRTWACT